jgi:hypothetical protein
MTSEELEKFNLNAPPGTPPEDLLLDPDLGLPRWYVGGAVSPTVSPLDLIGVPARPATVLLEREAIVIARLRALRYERGRTGALTDHGALRYSQRGVTDMDIDDAVAPAIRRGTTVTKRGGYYNQLQTHYRGSNGLTVIIADEGRKAGQVITLYGSKTGGKF